MTFSFPRETVVNFDDSEPLDSVIFDFSSETLMTFDDFSASPAGGAWLGHHYYLCSSTSTLPPRGGWQGGGLLGLSEFRSKLPLT